MTGRNPLVCLVILAALASALIFGTAAASAGNCQIGEVNYCNEVIAVTKTGPAYVNAGDPATYTITVYNQTDYEALEDVTVSDDKCSDMSAPSGDSNSDGNLDTGEVWTYTCTYVPAGDPGDTVENTATATAYGPEQEGQVGDMSTHFTTLTALHVTKTVDKTTADPFDDLDYTITVTNDGPDRYGYSGYLSDQGCDNLQSTDPDAEGTGFGLNPGESATFTCTHNFDPEQDGKSYTNEACVSAQPMNLDTPASAIEQQYPLTVCDSATTTLAQHVVTGRVFEDMNADGMKQDGEPAFPGIVVYADLNKNGARDEGEPASTSDGQGNYSLNVGLGKTTIREDVPGGATCSFPAGCAYALDLPANSPPIHVIGCSCLARAVDPAGKDFGDWRPASVSGTVAGDQNGNGVRDAGDNALAGIQVFADLNGNGTLDQGEPSATTAADGSYSIGGLEPGGYVIRHVLVQDGRTCTGPAPGCNYDLILQSNGAAAQKDFLDAPAPGQLVLPTRIIPGIARLTGKSGCIAGSGFDARIRGTKMTRVIFFVDGQALKSIALPRDNKRYRFRVDIRRLRVGRHVLAVQVTFTSGSHTKTKTLRLSFQRCAAQLRAPRFTG